MFTGIIMDVGCIESVDFDGTAMHLEISTALDTREWKVGDSVAVDGCCLTITELRPGGRWRATLSAETLRLTHFSQVKCGQRVNLEPALRVGDPLGGHMVTGHIDGLARLSRIEQRDTHRGYTFSVPKMLAPLLVHKGSVALNGVSLTINEVGDEHVSVHLIPHTLAHTNLGDLRPGDEVNIETDILGRYIQRMLAYGLNKEKG